MPDRNFASFLLVLVCAAAAWTGLGGDLTVARAGEYPAPSAAPSSAPSAILPEAPVHVLYPPERIPLRFDHARHVKTTGLTCLYCHTRVATSRSTADRLLPPPERCDACHGTDHGRLDHVTAGVGAAAACGFCHEGHETGNQVARVVIPIAFVRSDHAAHWARGIPCGRCHGGVERGGLPTSRSLPEMKICLECHIAGGSAPAACDVCHLTEEGRLRTAFPTGALLPTRNMNGLEHGPDFMVRHKIVAGADSAACATCHTERECTDCHDGRVRPRKIHPNDWLGLHAVAARQNDPVCTSCHREQSFCVSCHQRADVALSSPYGNLGDRGRFHPPKAVWSDLPRTPRHHAWEAERNITACVSCHIEKECALCHASALKGGRGGLSPHPPGFVAGCRSALAKNARPCLFCHDARDQNLAQCQ
jgi:hypothetical protein